MNINEQDRKRCSVVPYEWWVAGLLDSNIYVYCSRTAEWGIVDDATLEERGEAAEVDIRNPQTVTIPEASYSWRDHSRVRVIRQKNHRGTPAELLRSSLLHIVNGVLDQSELRENAQARCQAIHILEEAVLRLDRLEFLQFYNEAVDTYFMTEY